VFPTNSLCFSLSLFCLGLCEELREIAYYASDQLPYPLPLKKKPSVVAEVASPAPSVEVTRKDKKRDSSIVSSAYDLVVSFIHPFTSFHSVDVTTERTRSIHVSSRTRWKYFF
jgi:hypothetical protein